MKEIRTQIITNALLMRHKKGENMKAYLVFNLPEEREELHFAQKGLDYSLALDEIDNHLRNRLKYETLSDEVHDALQQVRDILSSNRPDGI
jgi:uncharacterized protein (UPF0128 family)